MLSTKGLTRRARGINLNNAPFGANAKSLSKPNTLSKSLGPKEKSQRGVDKEREGA
jgi:hypothetical protein